MAIDPRFFRRDRPPQEKQIVYGKAPVYGQLESFQPGYTAWETEMPPAADERPESAPPAVVEEPMSTQEILFIGARYSLYGGIGYLVAEQFLGGRGLIGAGVGVGAGWLIEKAAEAYIQTEQTENGK